MIIEMDDGSTINSHDPDRDRRARVTTITVRVSFDGPTPKEAYTALCEALEPAVVAEILDYETVTYSTGDDATERPATDLWPRGGDDD